MRKTIIFSLLLVSSLCVSAQKGSDFMTAFKVANANVPFNIYDKGEEFRVKWGMDTSWNWDYNVLRGVAHFGIGQFETGRISFQPIAEVIDKGDGTYELTATQKANLKSRCDNILKSGCDKVEINNDQENALSDANKANYEAFYLNKPQAWYKLIKASVAYAKTCGVDVVSIAPFNEPDYTAWGQGTQASMREVCRLIKADPYFDDIRVMAGNTLNCDQALSWYNYCIDYIDEGNTHQLAGSFDNYAAFFQKVRADGKIATADELHNVGEAIVGVQYGMQNGIWWAFDSKARGQFMKDSNQGVRIGYGESRGTWTSAAVYRNEKTGEVHGFMGSSERQANNASFAFISTTKDVYVNGYGPTRMYVYDIPGGTGYQKGQINAERLFDITWGEDVAPAVINGTYQIMNASSRKMLTYNGTGNVQSSTRKNTGTTQQWKVYPGYVDGDISYWFIDNAIESSTNTKTHLNLLNNNLDSGTGVICYDAGHSANEQWYLKYVSDGYYYIINRLSNKYLYCSATATGTNVTVMNEPQPGIQTSVQKRYLWRLMPVDAAAEVKAPAAPTELKAKANSASIRLSWTAPEDEDLASYTILRSDEDGWNTIGRNDTLTTFLDNTALPGKRYTYKVVAVDYSGNRSVASDTLAVSLPKKKALICQLQFDDDLTDQSANQFDASLYGNVNYSQLESMVKSGTKSVNFSGKSYAMIPYAAACQEEMTVCTWFRWGSDSNWARVFDFGNDENHYMFLTPSNGSEMRFVMKNGGDEQILGTGKKLSASQWCHVAVSLKPDGDRVSAVIYLNGDTIASTDDFTIRPSDIAPSLCYIGRSMYLADPLINARYDDFRIYSYALNQEEIKNVMGDTGETSEDLRETHLKGDVNEDGKVDINDVVAIINQMAGTATWQYANVNEDEVGKVDINDVVAVINIMAGN